MGLRLTTKEYTETVPTSSANNMSSTTQRGLREEFKTLQDTRRCMEEPRDQGRESLARREASVKNE
jgi:hypothetical protein